MEGMLDNLSQPVAFATAPLGSAEGSTPAAQRALRRDGSLSSDTDIEDPMATRFTRRIGMGKNVKVKTDRSLGATSKLDALKGARAPSVDLGEDGFDDDIFEEGQ